MKIREKVFYFGFSLKFLQALFKSELYEIVGVLTQKDKYTEEFKQFCDENGLILYIVSNKNELTKYCDILKIEKVLMYEFGIIIPEKICKEINIVNFHPGNLYNNRGANPIIWSVLLPDIGAMMSVYRISGEIDCGELISTKSVTVSVDDTCSTLKLKIEDTISELLIEVQKYFAGTKSKMITIVKDGIYRRRVCEEDYTIDMERDTVEIIKRKINSQDRYKGAIWFENGERKYAKAYRQVEKEFYVIFDDNTEICLKKSDIL